MKRRLVAVVIIVAIAGLFACNVPIPGPTPSTHVYIAGSVGKSISNTVPAYWKDGVLYLLPLTNGSTSGQAFGIAEDRSGNLYVAGGLQNGQVGYWRNSTFVPLPLGAYGAGTTAGIAVDTDGNVWVEGEVGASATSLDTFVYWKNGTGPSFLASSPSQVWGIQADLLGNVYIIGNLVTGPMLPYVWKNGANPTQQGLLGDNTNAYIQQSALSMNGLSIFGVEWGGTTGGPAYWSNGVPTALPVGAYDPNGDWISAGVAASPGGDLAFVAAYGPTTTATTLLYWATATSTPVPMTMPGGYTTFGNFSNAAFDSKGGFINPGQVGKAGTDVNGAVLDDGVPVYWRDGIPHLLPMGAGNSWGAAGWVVVGP